jgi:hypothetical protein
MKAKVKSKALPTMAIGSAEVFTYEEGPTTVSLTNPLIFDSEVMVDFRQTYECKGKRRLKKFSVGLSINGDSIACDHGTRFNPCDSRIIRPIGYLGLLPRASPRWSHHALGESLRRYIFRP